VPFRDSKLTRILQDSLGGNTKTTLLVRSRRRFGRRDGMAWHGMAWHGMAWHGMAWHGMACSPVSQMGCAVYSRPMPSPRL
jgi:hypothetical protein